MSWMRSRPGSAVDVTEANDELGTGRRQMPHYPSWGQVGMAMVVIALVSLFVFTVLVSAGKMRIPNLTAATLILGTVATLTPLVRLGLRVALSKSGLRTAHGLMAWEDIASVRRTPMLGGVTVSSAAGGSAWVPSSIAESVDFRAGVERWTTTEHPLRRALAAGAAGLS